MESLRAERGRRAQGPGEPRPPLLVIVGPTAVGKTEVAVRLASRVPLEVVSADSRQIYRGMEIGTGTPSAAERRAVPHHLLGLVDPHERYHVARFREDALRAIAGIRARRRLPAVVGGTGLYVRALLKGLAAAPPADLALRQELQAFAAAHGAAALHGRLAERDPAASRRLHPNDSLRVVRALEVGISSERARAAGDAEARPQPPEAAAGWAEAVPPFRLLMVGLRLPREALGRRIAERVRGMVTRGMMQEVKALLAGGCEETLPSMAGIGYRQFCAVIGGRLTEEEAVRLTIRDTVRYAKRQMTWFARDPEVRWVDVEAVGGLAAAAGIVAEQLATEGLIE